MVDLHDVYEQQSFHAKAPGNAKRCKQFSCNDDAYARLVTAYRRMLGPLDRTAIMAGMEPGLPHSHIAHLTGRSPSVVCREIACRADPDVEYRAEEASKDAHAARPRPKKGLMDRDKVLHRRVNADLSRRHTPPGLRASTRRSVRHTAHHRYFHHPQGRTVSVKAIYT